MSAIVSYNKHYVIIENLQREALGGNLSQCQVGRTCLFTAF